jgi:signal peptidase II
MTISRKVRLFFLLCLLLCTVGCDQVSKHMARTGLGQAGSVTLPAGLGELRLAENPGSFLSVGALLPAQVRFGVFTFAVGVGLVALFAHLTICPHIRMTRFVGLSLVLAGGMSNLLDRILRHGLVTDFVTVQIGPFRTGVFNVADVLIMIGVCTIVWTFWRRSAPDRPTNRIHRSGR